MSKSIAGSTTKFLYDGLNPAQELDASNSSNANLLTGGRLDEYLQRSDSVGARSFLSDNVDSTLVLTDENGFLQTQYTYEPFGNTNSVGRLTRIPTSTPGAKTTARDCTSTALATTARRSRGSLRRIQSASLVAILI
jgi:hypothetical protein